MFIQFNVFKHKMLSPKIYFEGANLIKSNFLDFFYDKYKNKKRMIKAFLPMI